MGEKLPGAAKLTEKKGSKAIGNKIINFLFPLPEKYDAQNLLNDIEESLNAFYMLDLKLSIKTNSKLTIYNLLYKVVVNLYNYLKAVSAVGKISRVQLAADNNNLIADLFSSEEIIKLLERNRDKLKTLITNNTTLALGEAEAIISSGVEMIKRFKSPVGDLINEYNNRKNDPRNNPVNGSDISSINTILKGIYPILRNAEITNEIQKNLGFICESASKMAADQLINMGYAEGGDREKIETLSKNLAEHLLTNHYNTILGAVNPDNKSDLRDFATKLLEDDLIKGQIQGNLPFLSSLAAKISADQLIKMDYADTNDKAGIEILSGNLAEHLLTNHYNTILIQLREMKLSEQQPGSDFLDKSNQQIKDLIRSLINNESSGSIGPDLLDPAFEIHAKHIKISNINAKLTEAEKALKERKGVKSSETPDPDDLQKQINANVGAAQENIKKLLSHDLISGNTENFANLATSYINSEKSFEIPEKLLILDFIQGSAELINKEKIADNIAGLYAGIQKNDFRMIANNAGALLYEEKIQDILSSSKHKDVLTNMISEYLKENYAIKDKELEKKIQNLLGNKESLRALADILKNTTGQAYAVIELIYSNDKNLSGLASSLVAHIAQKEVSSIIDGMRVYLGLGNSAEITEYRSVTPTSAPSPRGGRAGAGKKNDNIREL